MCTTRPKNPWWTVCLSACWYDRSCFAVTVIQKAEAARLDGSSEVFVDERVSCTRGSEDHQR